MVELRILSLFFVSCIECAFETEGKPLALITGQQDVVVDLEELFGLAECFFASKITELALPFVSTTLIGLSIWNATSFVGPGAEP